MMHIHPIEADDLARFAQVATAPEHVAAVHAYLARMTNDDAMRPAWCWIAEQNGRAVGRGAAWKLPRADTPSDLVLLDLPFDEPDVAQHILREIVAATRAAGGSAIGHVVDDPPQAPQWQKDAAARHALLRRTGWTIARVTDRWERHGCDGIVPPDRLHFRSLSEVGDDAFIAVVERISDGSLDQRIGDERQRHGANAAARREFEDLQTMDYQPAWWEVASTPSGELVGMVMPTGSPTFGTIGYIGVVPEQRGHGYVDALLARGTLTLCKAGYTRLVCDTDTSNTPMANAFRRAAWTRFATRHEYELAAGTP
jgi:RimJ/RimL family protein N-acetyltransferase